MQQRCTEKKRTAHIINLDPAADHFDYTPAFDIQTLITVEDVMKDFGYGPNGALMYCMEFLTKNLDWLHDEIADFQDDYLIFDCPGQIEIFTSHNFMNTIVKELDRIGYKLCGVFCMDALFLMDLKKFISGSMVCLSGMVRLGIPYVSLLTKCDLIQDKERLEMLLESEPLEVVSQMDLEERNRRKQALLKLYGNTKEAEKIADEHIQKDPLAALTRSIGTVLSDYSLVNFVTLDLSDEYSSDNVLQIVDHCLQYGEDEEIEDKYALTGDELAEMDDF